VEVLSGKVMFGMWSEKPKQKVQEDDGSTKTGASDEEMNDAEIDDAEMKDSTKDNNDNVIVSSENGKNNTTGNDTTNDNTVTTNDNTPDKKNFLLKKEVRAGLTSKDKCNAFEVLQNI
jgi:hypothetical protein